MTESVNRRISVIDAAGQALDRMNKVLFDPFDLGKWFVVGFGAWLAQLGKGNGGSRFNFNVPFGSSSSGPTGPGGGAPEFDQVMQNLRHSLPIIIPIAVVVILAVLAIWAVVIWLNSRGDFIFAHCVATNKAEVTNPWRRYARQGNSLFLVRLGASVIWALVLLIVGGVALFVVVNLQRQDARPSFETVVLPLLVVALPAVPVLIAIGLFLTFLRDFAVPIMMVRDCTCGEAWYELKNLMRANVGRIVLYVLFRWVLGFLVGIIMTVVACTCCTALCLLMIPYINAVALLPATVFMRSYSLCYLAQYGPQYDVFGPEDDGQTPAETIPPGGPSYGPIEPGAGGPVEPDTIEIRPREVEVEPEGSAAPPRQPRGPEPDQGDPWRGIEPPPPPPYSG